MAVTKKKHVIVARLGVLVLCLALIMSTLVVNVSAEGNTTITAESCPHFTIIVDGSARTFYNSEGQEVQPIVYNGTTYLPLRAIGELMGKNVNWDQSTYTVSLSGTRTAPAVTGTPDTTAKQQYITAQIRRDFSIVVDGTKRTFLDSNGNTAYPLLYNGITYLPLKAIGELMGKSVAWNGATNTITLSGSSGLVTDADSFNNGNTGNTGNTSTGNTGTTTPNTGNTSSNGLITAEQAKAKALAHAGLTASQVSFIRQQLEWENGRQVYDVEFYTADYKEYDYEIDAITGAVLSFDYDADHYTPPSGNTTSGSYIGEAQAKNIALGKVPGATAANIVKFKLDYDDGRAEYDIEIIYRTMEYEFEIDARTGTILKWESESIYD